jgi:hypothetical protein
VCGKHGGPATRLRNNGPSRLLEEGRRCPKELAFLWTMSSSRNKFLVVGAVLSAMAALVHVGCIVFGASWYRFFGAGERMARMAAAGHWSPTAITSCIVVILSCWSLYALSGAGVIGRLPLVRTALCIITGVYLFRGVAFAPFHGYFPGIECGLRAVEFGYWSCDRSFTSDRSLAGVAWLTVQRGLSTNQPPNGAEQTNSPNTA